MDKVFGVSTGEEFSDAVYMSQMEERHLTDTCDMLVHIESLVENYAQIPSRRCRRHRAVTNFEFSDRNLMALVVRCNDQELGFIVIKHQFVDGHPLLDIRYASL